MRLNTNAVYLGTPGAHQSCPDRVAGRDDVVVLEPGSATAATATTQSTIDQEITAQAPGIEANAYYGAAGSAAVGKVLASGGLAAATAATATARHTAAVAPATLSGGSTTFTGEAFDACEDPSASTLNSWSSSPCRGVGIYIGGANTGCSQPNLTASALSSEVSDGWHFFPIHVLADENGTLYEFIQDLSTGVWSNTSPAISETGGISAWYNAAKSSAYIMADESGSLHEVIQNMTTGAWSNASPGISL